MAIRNVAAVAKRLFKKKTVAIIVLVVLAIVAVLVVMRKRKEGMSDWAKEFIAAKERERAYRQAYELAAASRFVSTRGEAQAKAAKCGGPSMNNWYKDPRSSTGCCERKNPNGCPQCYDFLSNSYRQVDYKCNPKIPAACDVWRSRVLPDKRWTLGTKIIGYDSRNTVKVAERTISSTHSNTQELKNVLLYLKGLKVDYNIDDQYTTLVIVAPC